MKRLLKWLLPFVVIFLLGWFLLKPPIERHFLRSALREADRTPRAALGFDARHIPDLVAALGDTEADVRIGAALALGRIGAEARPALPALADAVDDAHPRVAFRAAQAIAWIDRESPAATHAASILVKAAIWTNGRVYSPDDGSGASEALEHLGVVALPALIDKLKDDDAVARLFEKIGPPAVPPLAQMLRSPDEKRRDNALLALAQMKTGARDGFSDIVRLPLRHRSYGAVAATECKAAVPVLGGALLVDDEARPATEALGRLRSQGKPLVPVLLMLLSSDDRELRWNAAEAMARIDAKALHRTLPNLVGEGEKAEWDTWLAVHKARTRDGGMWSAPIGTVLLPPEGSVGPVDVDLPPIPWLIKAFRGNDDSLAREAADALKTIGPKAKSAVPELVRLSREHWNWERRVQAESLARALDPAGEERISCLMQEVERADEVAAAVALARLGKLGAAARRALPTVAAALKQPKTPVRQTAALVLARIDPEGMDAAPHLVQALGDPDGVVRLNAMHSLASCSPAAAKPAIPRLIDLLADADSDVRLGACVALGRLGDGDPSVTAALRPLQKDEDAAVQRAARNSLERLEVGGRPLQANEAEVPRGENKRAK